MVDADIDPADIFSDHTQHEQDHPADQCDDGHQAGPTGRDLGVQQFMDHCVQGHHKSQKGNDAADDSGDGAGTL